MTAISTSFPLTFKYEKENGTVAHLYPRRCPLFPRISRANLLRHGASTLTDWRGAPVYRLNQVALSGLRSTESIESPPLMVLSADLGAFIPTPDHFTYVAPLTISLGFSIVDKDELMTASVRIPQIVRNVKHSSARWKWHTPQPTTPDEVDLLCAMGYLQAGDFPNPYVVDATLVVKDAPEHIDSPYKGEGDKPVIWWIVWRAQQIIDQIVRDQSATRRKE